MNDTELDFPQTKSGITNIIKIVNFRMEGREVFIIIPREAWSLETVQKEDSEDISVEDESEEHHDPVNLLRDQQTVTPDISFGEDDYNEEGFERMLLFAVEEL